MKAAVTQILALGHYTFTSLVARASHAPKRRTRLQSEIDRLQQEVALLQEELRIKDARMRRLHPHRRPFYTPFERMAILEMRAARGWSAQQTAVRFALTLTTVAAWMARINEEGANALLRLQVPVNKFPDLVRYIVQRLKVMCPRLDKAKIAEMLCRAGLHLAPSFGYPGNSVTHFAVDGLPYAQAGTRRPRASHRGRQVFPQHTRVACGDSQ